MTYRHLRTAIPAAVVAALLACAPAFAETLAVTAPEKVGMSKARLDQITTVFKADIDKGRLPGMVVAVARHGKLAYFEAFGYRDPAGKRRCRRTHLLDRLDDQADGVGRHHDAARGGQLLLNDPVGQYLPPLAR